MTPKLSIVIPAWEMDEEKGRLIRNCVESIKQHTDVTHELIIVDNGSTVAKDFMRDSSDICIVNRENLGFAAAINQGFRLARGKHVAFMNDDIVVGQSWASHMVRMSELGVIVMPAVMRPELIQEGETFAQSIQRTQDERKWHPQYGDCDPFPELDGWGSLFMGRRDVFQRVQDQYGELMSEEYRYTMFDDRDLWLRLCLMGVRNVRTHKVWVHHVGNATWGKIPNQERIYLENEAIYREKVARLWTKGHS